ncbi:MAG TPA: hypothetical protein PKA31_00585 [Candidatus Moranbacteria bacterium]|nr:hypothetical protein [Candidatus Moranbacteria bacterium]
MRKLTVAIFVSLALFSLAYFAGQFFSGGAQHFSSWGFPASADDDEEDEDDEDDDEEEDEEEKEEKKEYRTETVVVEPARTITKTELRTVTLADSDRDGIVDEDDPYPQISQIYIVQDGDGDGISDELENIAAEVPLEK